MRKIIFIIAGFLVFLSASPVFAQRGEPYGRRNFPVSESPCWTKPYLEATPEQLKSLEDLHRSFYKEILALRKKYMKERYELNSLLASPKPDAKMVLKTETVFGSAEEDG